MWQVWRPDPVLALEQGRQFPDDFGARLVRKARGELRAARAPIQALDLVGENDPLDGEILRKCNLERVSLCATRDRAEQAKADLSIVRTRRDDDGGTAPGLLVSQLGVESDPHDVAAVRNVGSRQLPGFPARQRARVHLGMAIPLRNFLQQLV